MDNMMNLKFLNIENVLQNRQGQGPALLTYSSFVSVAVPFNEDWVLACL